VKRYEIAPEAKKDLDAIWDRIAKASSAEIATNFLWKFYETFGSIGSSPAAGVAALDFRPEGTRRFPMGNYIIYYRPVRGGKGKVLISRGLHGKRLQKRSYHKKP
jgi:plasmid stabilization system protein ParE